MSKLAPIVLFVYNRPDHTRRTLGALSDNLGAKESDLIVYQDGIKNNEAKEVLLRHCEVGEIIQGFQEKFRSLRYVRREQNQGLAKSIITGLDEVFQNNECAIILEDDLITSKAFLQFMNDGIKYYKDEPSIASISGYIEPIKLPESNTYFSTKGTSWGWATWSRVWNGVEWNTGKLLGEFSKTELIEKFNYAGYKYYDMLWREHRNEIDSWAIRFYASSFLNKMMHVIPGKSLVRNIGHDNSGVHCVENRIFANQHISDNNPLLKSPPVFEDAIVRKRMEEYYFKQSSFRFPKLSLIKWKLINLLR